MKVKWQPIVKATSSLLFQWWVFEGDKEKYFQSSLNVKAGLSNEKIIDGEIFIDLNEWMELEQVLSSEVKKNRSFFRQFIQLCYRYSDSLIGVSKEIQQNKNLSKLKDNQLLSLFEKYQRSVLGLMPFLNATLVLDNVLKKEITNTLVSELGITAKKEQDLLLSKLIIPKKKSYFVKETGALLKIALKLHKNKNLSIKRDIQDFLDSYAWTTCLAYVGRFQTEEDVRKKVKDILKEGLDKRLARVRQVREKTATDYRAALSHIKGSRKLVELFDLAREFIYLQTYRLDVLFMVHYFVYPLFKEIGRRNGLKAEEVVYLTGEEIVELLRGNFEVNKEEVKKRMDHFTLLKIKGEFSLLSGERATKLVKTAVKTKQVKGTVANRGRAAGKAKLVYEVEDISKVNRGDIIVSPMTRPELVPAIIKASGIITDFGGMLCHAAIVSREFGIPCVVGTKNATKVFKDNDLVELNAYEGVARKL